MTDEDGSPPLFTRRAYLVSKALMTGAASCSPPRVASLTDALLAHEAVSSVAIEHPEWDMNEERPWAEWQALYE